MSIRFDDRVAIVTGAAAGLGRSHALALAARGARVVVNDFGGDVHGTGGSSEPAERVADEIRQAGGEAMSHGASVANDEQVAHMVAAVMERWGRVDILINNAGIGGPAPAEFAPGAEARRQLEVNLLGAWRVTAACVDALVDSRGRIVMLASRMAVMQLPLAAAYGASKRALVAYADALRMELGTHVGVTCVYPSSVQSPIHSSTTAAGLSLEGMSRYEPLDGVVDAVMRAALSRRPRRDLPTSARGALEFFLARHLPALTDRIVARTLAGRAGSGAFAGAPLAAGVVARHEAVVSGVAR